LKGGEGEMEQSEDEIFQSLKQHDDRLITLEISDKSKTERLQAVEANYTNLENTILKENRDTRAFFQETMNKQWDLISGKNEYDDAESQRNHDLDKTKIERYSEIVLKIVGAGGVLILVTQALIQ